MEEEKYKMRLEALYKVSPSVQNAGFAPDAYKPGLDGMKELDASVGNPSGKLRFIHVAGTNGKGSVCSMLAASLAASGLKTGLYTSPHLVDFRERMKICSPDGFRMIGKEDVWEFLETYDKNIEGRSFFEVTTGMALWWFAREEADICVIETGLGGRLDSTNIITPELSVITGIGLDHCALLGDTRALIAGEKAGIFKPGTPALVWGGDEETDPVFERAALYAGCPLFHADALTPSVPEWELDLGADCQQTNLRTVISALSLLGMEADKDAICQAAARTGLRGRWEILSDTPLTICDIGHNPEALGGNFLKLKKTGRPVIMVYGTMADKDYRTNIGLIPDGATVIATAPDTPRALGTEALLETLKSLRPDVRAFGSGSVADAVKKALETAAETPGCIIYIGGSTFVVSEALEAV